MSSSCLFKCSWRLVKPFFRFLLFPYTTANQSNGKLLYVTVPDSDYPKWVAKYRQEAAREEDGDADTDDIWGKRY